MCLPGCGGQAVLERKRCDVNEQISISLPRQQHGQQLTTQQQSGGFHSPLEIGLFCQNASVLDLLLNHGAAVGDEVLPKALAGALLLSFTGCCTDSCDLCDASDASSE